MNERFINKLIEKYLLKTITVKVLETFNEQFENVFKEKCNLKNENDTTLGKTFKTIELMAYNDIVIFLTNQIEEINLFKATDEKNIFRNVIFDMWEEFSIHLDIIKDYVESILADEYWDKQKELERNGIIDSFGNYIKKEV